MESKKTPQTDLTRWSSTFTNLGLVISISAVLVAFEWKAYDDFKIKDFSNQSEVWDLPEIPNTIQEPPVPPIQVPVEIIIEPDEKFIDEKTNQIFDIDYNESEELPEIVLSAPPIIDDPDEIKDFVDKQASFVGGMEAWYKYLQKNLTYPNQARRMGIEGTVIVRFIVNTDGSIQDVEVLRGIAGGCDEIAKKVIEESPNWNPGINKDRPVRSRMTMPIRFKLN